MSNTPIYDETVASNKKYSHRSPLKLYQRIVSNFTAVMLIVSTVLIAYVIAKVLFFQ